MAPLASLDRNPEFIIMVQQHHIDRIHPVAEPLGDPALHRVNQFSVCHRTLRALMVACAVTVPLKYASPISHTVVVVVTL